MDECVFQAANMYRIFILKKMESVKLTAYCLCALFFKFNSGFKSSCKLPLKIKRLDGKLGMQVIKLC